MNNDTQFLASGHSLKKISSKISSLQATKESVGVLGIAFGKKKTEYLYPANFNFAMRNNHIIWLTRKTLCLPKDH